MPQFIKMRTSEELGHEGALSRPISFCDDGSKSPLGQGIIALSRRSQAEEGLLDAWREQREVADLGHACASQAGPPRDLRVVLDAPVADEALEVVSEDEQ